jgi:class 3 adenylate cyclase
VNTASRLESLTKDVPHQMLISDSTRQLLSNEQSLVFVDEVTLRGRTTPTQLWTLSEGLQ